MRRTVLLLVLAVVLGGCGSAESTADSLPPPRAAEPQHAELNWRESYPAAMGERLVFGVGELDVTRDGWAVDVAVENRTPFDFELDTGPADYGFGLMLFHTGDLKELEEANREGRLPAVRRARRIEPAPPRVLRAGGTWRGTLSAPGSLGDGSWLHVVFGTFRGLGDAPDEFARVVWFTDRAHQL
jgi:hypothetical protein